MTPEETTEAVRAAYAATATNASTCCVTPTEVRAKIGYTQEESEFVLDSDLGVGCGAPTSFANLKPGEAVVDLGCGAGIDVFLASRKVRGGGSVIGVDMTGEMLERARRKAKELDLGDDVEIDFRLGELSSLPVESGTCDCVISNCVINLCADKRKALAEAFRVLKPGGRLCIADVVNRGKELPEALKTVEALAC